MPDLIPIVLYRIGAEDIESVDGRILHANLGIESHYADWIKAWIRKANLVQHRDYEVFHDYVKNPKGGRPTQEYALTVEAAKCIAMMSGGKHGDEVRLYFLARERQAITLERQTSTVQVKNPAHQMLIEAIVRLDAVEQQAERAQQDAAAAQARAAQAEAKAEHAEASAQRAYEERDFFTVAEYMQFEGLQQKIPQREYKALSDHLQAYCMNKGIPFRDILIGGKPWAKEHGYHRSVYVEVLPGWLHRRYAQENLTVLYPPQGDPA